MTLSIMELTVTAVSKARVKLKEETMINDRETENTTQGARQDLVSVSGINKVKPEVLLDCQTLVLSPYGKPLISRAIWLLEYSHHQPALPFSYS